MLVDRGKWESVGLLVPAERFSVEGGARGAWQRSGGEVIAAAPSLTVGSRMRTVFYRFPYPTALP